LFRPPQATDEASFQAALQRISNGQALAAAQSSGLAASQLFVILLGNNITLHRSGEWLVCLTVDMLLVHCGNMHMPHLVAASISWLLWCPVVCVPFALNSI
jgi:hypothetical protein